MDATTNTEAWMEPVFDLIDEVLNSGTALSPDLKDRLEAKAKEVELAANAFETKGDLQQALTARQLAEAIRDTVRDLGGSKLS